MTVQEEIVAERARAHAKHGKTSMEALPSTDPARLAVLTEEVGEAAEQTVYEPHHGGHDDHSDHSRALTSALGGVARVYNDAAHARHPSFVDARKLANALAAVERIAVAWLEQGRWEVGCCVHVARRTALRAEVVQVAAMAQAWRDNLAGGAL